MSEWSEVWLKPKLQTLAVLAVAGITLYLLCSWAGCMPGLLQVLCPLTHDGYEVTRSEPTLAFQWQPAEEVEFSRTISFVAARPGVFVFSVRRLKEPFPDADKRAWPEPVSGIVIHSGTESRELARVWSHRQTFGHSAVGKFRVSYADGVLRIVDLLDGYGTAVYEGEWDLPDAPLRSRFREDIGGRGVFPRNSGGYIVCHQAVIVAEREKAWSLVESGIAYSFKDADPNKDAEPSGGARW